MTSAFSSALLYVLPALLLVELHLVSSDNIPPRLQTCQSQYSTQNNCGFIIIREEMPADSIIATFTAEDGDSPTVTFSLSTTPGQDSGWTYYFKIEAVPGQTKMAYLKILALIDREVLTTDTFYFTLNLLDGTNTAIKSNIMVVVTEVNDNAPRFINQPYRCQMKENDPSTTCSQVAISDLDKDSTMTMNVVGNSLFTASLGSATNLPNSIHGKQWAATIGVTSSLNYETMWVYQLSLLAVDGAGHNTTADLIVNVIDQPDLPPVFLKLPYATSLKEEEPIGTYVYSVTAQDGDRGINNPIAYSLQAGTFNEFFTINASNGVITVKKPLDRESASVHSAFGIVELTVQATEVTQATQPANISITTTTVRISILDVNDYVPTFDKTSYNATVPENTQVGIPITMATEMVVKDLDQVDNGRFNLSIEKNGAPYEVFSVSPTTVINEATVLIRVKNASVLDYETVKQLDFYVVAREFASPHKSASVLVTVNIEDANDNIPVFSQLRFQVNVSENSAKGTKIAQITATDKDTGTFGQIVYTLLDNSGKFGVNASSGELYVNVNASHDLTLLDREVFDTYYVNLQAEDNNGEGRGFRQYAQVEIKLLDLNDNAPNFTKPVYLGSVRENSATFEQSVQVQAVDRDLGPDNNRVSYSLLPTDYSANFSIDANTGVLSMVQAIDYESLPSNLNGVITLNVQAKDHGNPQLSSVAQINITVEDVNDMSPVFVQPHYITSINETAPSGSYTVGVKATDGDKPGSLQASIFYRIQSGGADKFAIDGESGNITVEKGAVLSVGHYNLTINAYDRGSPSLSGACTVYIQVLEVNNLNPFFPQPVLRHSTNEDVGPGTVVVNYAAKDPDTNAVLQYTIMKDVMTAQSPTGTNVLSSVYNFKDLFTVNGKGDIILNGKLDRETTEQLTIPILVNDTAAETPGQTAIGTLILTVNDVNDNFPEFQYTNGSTYYVSISESLKPTGTPPSVETSLTVVAIDRDRTASITYSLSDPSSTFTIHTQSGKVSLVKELNRETKDTYEFTVHASDGTYQVNASVYVTVLDANDNHPEFTIFNISVQVPEDAPLGTVITTVVATDEDLGEFGRVEYYLTGGGLGKFAVNKTTGDVSVAGALDRDIKDGDSYSLTIEARDNNGGAYQGKVTKTMTITVTDINDNAPRFSLSYHLFNSTKENQKANEIVGKIAASDKDEGANANLTYSLKAPPQGNDTALTLFRVETLTVTGAGGSLSYEAVIKTKKDLHNSYGCYNATLEATDAGNPPKKGSTDLTFCVEDVNDFTPKFVVPSEAIKTLYLNETESNKELIQVKAEDQDRGNNGIVEYSLTSSSNDHLKFRINKTSGQLYNIAALDRELQADYRFEVKANDLGQPRLTSSVRIVVEILDIDDNPPAFSATNQQQSLTISENNVLGSLGGGLTGSKIGTIVKAVDKDTGANADICYFILNNVTNLFYLNKFTGDLYVLSKLDREMKSSYEVIIKAVGPQYCNSTVYEWRPATSPGRRRLLYLDENPVPYNSNDNTITKVNVVVQDVNDSPPKFTKSFFFAGVTKDSPPTTIILEFNRYVVDNDLGNNSKLTYSLDGGIRITETLMQQLILQQLTDKVLHLNPNTGILTTGDKVYFQENMKGYFSLTVKVSDGKYEDTANATIYLLSATQRVIAVFRDPTALVGQHRDTFAAYLSNVTGLIVNVDNIVTHKDDYGNADNRMTDMYIHAIDNTTHEVVSAERLLKILDEKWASLKTLYSTYNVIEVKSTTAPVKTADFSNSFRIALIVVACIFSIVIFVVCISMFTCRKMYRRKLKAATASAFGGGTGNHTNSKTAHMPGTNLHTYEGSNPIWLESSINNAYVPDHLSDKDSFDGDRTNGHLPNHSSSPRDIQYDEQEVTVQLDADSDVPGASAPHGQDSILAAALAERERSAQPSAPGSSMRRSPPPAYSNGTSNMYPSTAI